MIDHFLLCFASLIFDVFASIRLAPDEKDLQIALLRLQLRILERKTKTKPRVVAKNLIRADVWRGLGGTIVVAQHTAKPIASFDRPAGYARGGWIGNLLPNALMRSCRVEELLILV
jgi:hypothetical protein